ncbi:diiron oxygenase [Vibrio fluvialis]|nr:diiron oxygenase [Vibrio fluvialis]
MSNYPEFLTFKSLNKEPTCIEQHFQTKVTREPDKVFYPVNNMLEPYFKSQYESEKFGAAQFLGFLHDTIAVEHNIVIPAIRDLHLLPIDIPDHPKEELYKLVTDEGHHAAQALAFVNAIKELFDLRVYEKGNEMPLFLRKLYEKKEFLKTEGDLAMFNLVIGVVTETRISKELGAFTNDEMINSAVVENCRSHQEDETIHASQFRALGKWSWENIDNRQREILAKLYAETTIARSYPDVNRLGFYFSQASGIDREEANKIISEIYRPEVLKEEMLIAARPTITFLKNMGVLEFSSARDVFLNAGIEV